MRAILFPSSEQEMLCQLVRWHYAVLLSRPHIWRSLDSKHGVYEPCGVFKPAIEGDRFQPCPDPFSGYLSVEYRHKGEVSGLSGSLVRTGTREARLSFPGWSELVNMQVSENPNVWRVGWPVWLNIHAAFVIPEEEVTPDLRITFRIRPLSFDAEGMVDHIAETSTMLLHEAGLLAGFVSAVKPLDKLAVAWLALAITEDRMDQQSREGDLA